MAGRPGYPWPPWLLDHLMVIINSPKHWMLNQADSQYDPTYVGLQWIFISTLLPPYDHSSKNSKNTPFSINLFLQSFLQAAVQEGRGTGVLEPTTNHSFIKCRLNVKPGGVRNPFSHSNNATTATRGNKVWGSSIFGHTTPTNNNTIWTFVYIEHWVGSIKICFIPNFNFTFQDSFYALRETVKYYFADVVRKQGGGVPPKSVTPFLPGKKSIKGGYPPNP